VFMLITAVAAAGLPVKRLRKQPARRPVGAIKGAST
jgi:hypothetical protein